MIKVFIMEECKWLITSVTKPVICVQCCYRKSPLIYITPLNVHRLFNVKSQPKTPFRGCTLQIKGTHTLLSNFCVILDMNKRSIMYGLAYGTSIGVGVAITFGVALENMAIGILMGLGSGISLGVGCSLLLSKRKSC